MCLSFYKDLISTMQRYYIVSDLTYNMYSNLVLFCGTQVHAYFIFADIVRHDQSERNEEIRTIPREEGYAKKEEKRKGKEPLDCLARLFRLFDIGRVSPRQYRANN